jgi:hypothetical protein
MADVIIDTPSSGLTPNDEAAIDLLTAVECALAAIKRPLIPTVANAALGAVATVIGARGHRIGPKTRSAIVALIEALREDIGS